jgi:hydrogenase maturation protease
MTNPTVAATGVTGAGARLRVVGCGNRWAADDGAGLEAIRRLRASGGFDGELAELPQGGLELMEILAGVGTVVFIDGVSSGAPVGTLHLVPLPSDAVVARALGSISSHGWGLAETLGLMAALGRPVPRVLLVGIEIESAVPNRALSRAVEMAVQTIVERFPALCAMLVWEENKHWLRPRRFAPGDVSFPGWSGDPDKSGQAAVAKGGS